MRDDALSLYIETQLYICVCVYVCVASTCSKKKNLTQMPLHRRGFRGGGSCCVLAFLAVALFPKKGQATIRACVCR